jgi:hypothetical protein
MLAQLEETIAGSDKLTATRRAELRKVISAEARPQCQRSRN